MELFCADTNNSEKVQVAKELFAIELQKEQTLAELELRKMEKQNELAIKLELAKLNF